jgi:hypothetical protein
MPPLFGNLLTREYWIGVDITQHSDEWRFRLRERPLLLAIYAVYIPLLVAGTSPSSGITLVNVIGVALTAGFLWSACRIWGVGFTAGDSEVKVRSLLHTYRVPWSDISHFEIGQFGSLFGRPRLTTIGVVRRDGTVVCAKTFNAGIAPPHSDQARSKFQAAVDELNRLNLDHARAVGQGLRP